ncbi:DUF2505 domain-containing protein [Nakamurella sp.]|uniref:DUF2505 domain-containing protein n=1 Tax=Nakamurella sp. TaxID=1869182 RepID=UPI003784AC41
MPTPLKVTQQFDAPAADVFALFNDPDFIKGRLDDSGALDPEVVQVVSTDTGVTIVTRQAIPASALPSMVASMIQGDPSTERTENWRPDGDGYTADFSVTVQGAPASLKGTMSLTNAGSGSTLSVVGSAAVPIPIFGAKIEGVIASQISELLASEEAYIKSRLAG